MPALKQGEHLDDQLKTSRKLLGEKKYQD